MLHSICFDIVPQISCFSFLIHFFELWSSINSKSDYSALLQQTDSFIKEYINESCLLLYAPSTIALSAMFLVLNNNKLDMSNWLMLVPDCCLPVQQNISFSNLPVVRKNELLNIDACLNSIENLIYKRQLAKRATFEDQQYQLEDSSETSPYQESHHQSSPVTISFSYAYNEK